MKEFNGRVAVVTGGASGIGFAMAQRFAREGMRIVLADIDPKALADAESSLTATGAQVLSVRTDVSNYSDVETLAQRTIEAFGAVHILCNNAGVSSEPAPLWEQTEKDWQWVLNVNLLGVIHGIRAFVPIMIGQGTEGHIVNTASLAGLLSLPFGAPYHATKFAVVALTESLYYDFALTKTKLKASVLCPAWVKTSILNSARNRPDELKNEGGPRIEASWVQAYRKRIADGLTPEYVADRVFDAVRDEQLYILTHPEFKPAITWRAANIVEERNPDIDAALGGLKKDAAPA